MPCEALRSATQLVKLWKEQSFPEIRHKVRRVFQTTAPRSPSSEGPESRGPFSLTGNRELGEDCPQAIRGGTGKELLRAAELYSRRSRRADQL